MIPAPFSYRRASSAGEALELAAEFGDDAKFLAGGHSLLPLMKLRLAVPEVLIDIGRLPGLSYIRDEGDHIAIGALTRHHDLEYSALTARELPLLACAALLPDLVTALVLINTGPHLDAFIARALAAAPHRPASRVVVPEVHQARHRLGHRRGRGPG